MKKIFLLPFIALVSFSNVFAQTSDWPNKPVKIVVPFTPGGALDLTARELAKRLSTKYNQSFLVENLPGAGGTVGVNAVVKSKPDGYTLLVASTGQLSLQPAIYKNLPYDLFLKQISLRLILTDLLKYISIICILHHYTICRIKFEVV